MASFTRSARRGRGMKPHSAFSFFSLFMRNKLLLVVSLCFLTFCVNNDVTTAEITPARRLSKGNLYSRLLYFLVATSCSNIPTLDPIVLNVFSASWEWPNPLIEGVVTELHFPHATGVSKRDNEERKTQVLEALKRLRAEGSSDDVLHNSELLLFDPFQYLLGYTPASHANFHRSQDLPSTASAGEAESHKDAAAPKDLATVLVEDKPRIQPQSRLDDEPKPWLVAFEKEGKKPVEKKQEQRLDPQSCAAVGDNVGRPAAAYEGDAGTNSETDSTSADGSNNEELSGSISSAGVQPSTAGDAAQLLKNWRELSVSFRDKEMSAAGSTKRLFADAQTDDGAAVQEDLAEQWTAAERVRGVEEPVDEAELSTEDEEYEKEDDEDMLSQGSDDEEDSFVADEVRTEEDAVKEEGEKLISGDYVGPRPSQGSLGRDVAAEDIALRVVTPGNGRKTLYFQHGEEKNVSAQLRSSDVQVPDHSTSKRLPVSASKHGQAVESIAPTKVEEKAEATANRVNRETRLSSSVQLSRADFGQIATITTRVGAASAKPVRAGTDAGESAITEVHYAPLAAAHHRSDNTKIDGVVDERRTHDAETSTGRPAAALLASGDSVSAATTPPASSRHLTPHPSTTTTAEVTESADRPSPGGAAVIDYVKRQTGAAADVAAGSRVEEDDRITERIALDEDVLTIKSLAPSSSIQGRIVDAAALLSRSISSEATAKLTTPLVGSSAAQLLIRPLVRGTPSFIGAAAAVPPVLGTAAALFATATTGPHIALGAAPVVPVGGSHVVASAAARNAKESKEGCKRVSERERLRMMFESTLEAKLPTAGKKNVVAKPGIRAVMSGPIVQVARPPQDEIEEKQGAARSASQQEASVSAIERRLPVKQQGEAGRETTTEKDMTSTAVDARAKMVKDATAEVTKPIATKVEETGREGDVGELDKRTRSPATVYALAAEKRPSAVEVGKEPVWQRTAEEQAYPAADVLPTGNVLTRPGVQPKQQQYNAPSRVVSEAAKQEPHKEAKEAADHASTGALPTYQRFPNTKDPLEENFAHRFPGEPPQLPPQQQPHSRLSSPQDPQPTVTETPQQQQPSLPQPQRDVNHLNYQLPMRSPHDQKQKADPWKLHSSKEDKEQRQPTTEPSFAVPQRVRHPLMPQPQRTTRSEEGAGSEALGPTVKPVHAPSKDESSQGLQRELEQGRPQQSQQQEFSKELEEEKQPVDKNPRKAVERLTADPDQQVDKVAEGAEALTTSGEPEDLAWWRDVEHKASAHGRIGGTPENTAADSQCMSAGNEKNLEVVLERHCHSWCTTGAMERWGGKFPVWMFLHSTPIHAYWNSLKDMLHGFYEEHRPAVEEVLQESWRTLKRMRIQAEHRAKELLDVAAARSQQFQQQYPDLWLAAVWTIALLLLCRIITGRFFFLLQLLLSAMAYTFCCRRRAYGGLNEIDCSALATVNALLDDRQIKWLLTQTRKTSFLCECLRGRACDGDLPGIEGAGAPAALAGGDPAAAVAEGGGAAELEGTITSIFGYSAMNINAGHHAGPASQTEQQRIIGLLQKISQQQQEVTQALHGVERRLELVETGQRACEGKLQEAAATSNAMFESNSLHQVDSNFAILKLTMRLLQKVDPGTAAETVEQLQAKFLAHTETINETMAAIKARQLRALFGRHRAQCEREMYEKALASAPGRPAPVRATTAGFPLPPPGVAAVTAIPAPRPTASLSYPVAGPPPPPEMQLTASASLPVMSGASRPLPYSAAAGGPPPAAAVPKPEDTGALVPPHPMAPVPEPPQQSPATLALSPFGETERNVPWLVQQLLSIQQSLPELLLQDGEYHAQLVLTRKVGNTCQKIVLSPGKGASNHSDVLRKALGPISAAANKLLSGDASSGSSSVSSSRRGTLDERDIRNLLASPESAPESSQGGLFAPPSEAPQQTREDDKSISVEAAAAAVGPPPLAAAAPSFTGSATWINAEPKLLNGDVEQKTGQPAEEPAAETPLAAEMSPAPGAFSAAGSTEKAFSPVKQQPVRRSAAELFGEPEAPEPATRGSRRLSVEECFSPESKVLSRSAEQAGYTSNDHPETLAPSQTPFLACPGSVADSPQRPSSLLATSFSAPLFPTPSAGSVAPAAPAAFTPHFPPADASAFEAESSATAPLLPSPPTSPPSPSAVPAGPSSLLCSPFSGPAVAACPPSLSSTLFPPLPNGASVRPPPPTSTAAAPLLTSSMLADSSLNGVSSLPVAAHSAGLSSPAFVPGQSETGNPPLLTALTGVAAAPGILPSPPSARSFIAAAAATSASTSPFPIERKGSGAGLPPLMPPPPPSPFNTPSGPGSRRGSQDDILVNNGGNSVAAAFPPPPPSAYSQEQMAVTEGMASIALGSLPPPPPPSGGVATTALLTPPHMGGGIIGGTPIPPPPPTGSGPTSPLPPGGASTPPHFPPPPPPPPSRPPSALYMGEGGLQEAAASQATDALEGGSRPPTPLAPSTIPSGFAPPPPAFCGNGYSGTPFLSLPRRMSGSYPRPTESVTPTVPATTYQRPTRFPRERREPPKIQATTNPFGVPPPPSSVANLQHFGGGSGGATPSHNAA